MGTTRDLKEVYDLFLSVPGMNEPVKIDVKMSRKNVLLLAQVIQKGLSKEEGDIAALLAAVPADAVDELSGIAGEFLQKAGLVELNEKLKKM